MKPLLAHVYEAKRVQFPCWVQPKLNGVRALWQNGIFQSRDELPWKPHILQHISRELSHIDPTWVLDGELYVHGWLLQRINGAVTPIRLEPVDDTLVVEYHIFDRVDYGQPFQKRFLDVVEKLPTEHAKAVPTHIAHSEQEADVYYATFVDQGFEGLIYRLGDCPYTLPKQPVIHT